MNGRKTLVASLTTATSVLALISKKTISTVAYPMISDSRVMPSSYPLDASAINVYSTSPVNHTINYGEYDITVNCRAISESKAEALAMAVVTDLNRMSGGTSGILYYCSQLPVIPPMDEADNYNAPVTVTIKSRTDLP